MDDSRHEIIIVTLAAYLGVHPSAIQGTQDLARDWGLDALDLALLSLRLEDALDVSIGDDEIDQLRTVADLGVLVRGAPISSGDELSLRVSLSSSLREELRRTPRRERRKWMARQKRHGFRRSA